MDSQPSNLDSDLLKNLATTLYDVFRREIIAQGKKPIQESNFDQSSSYQKTLEKDFLSLPHSTTQSLPAVLGNQQPVQSDGESGNRLPRSFARVLDMSLEINQMLCKPINKGAFYSMVIDEELYKKGVDEHRNSIIGRVILVKKEKPLSTEALKQKLSAIWKVSDISWRVIPLGKGYYNISFINIADRNRVFNKTSWSLSPGTIRLSRWVRGFNPYKVSASIAQVWIRILELPLEYWHSSIILGIASAIGTPIKIDDRSL